MENQNTIINRVANSALKTIDLEDFYPPEKRLTFDISKWLFEGLILREKDFRECLKQHDWSIYKNSYVAIQCSSDAIIPSWAYLLITTKLHGFAKKVVAGSLELLENIIFQEIIENINLSEYKNKSIIIKGCSDKKIPLSAYTLLIDKLQPIAKSIMFGEPCSTVPLFKK